MNKKKLAAIIVVLSVCLGLLVHALLVRDRGAALYSCLASSAELVRYSYESGKLDRSKLGREWRLLSEAELKELGESLRRMPCSAISIVNSLPEDRWGRGIQIAVRRSQNQEVEVLAWSKGADGFSPSKDDIIVPYGATVPPASQNNR